VATWLVQIDLWVPDFQSANYGKRYVMKDDIVIKKRTLRMAAVFLCCVLLATLIGSAVGYRLGMQTPQEQLRGDLKIQEVADVKAVIYGIGGMFLGIIVSSIYVVIISSRRK